MLLLYILNTFLFDFLEKKFGYPIGSTPWKFLLPPLGSKFNFILHKVYGIQKDRTGHTYWMQKSEIENMLMELRYLRKTYWFWTFDPKSDGFGQFLGHVNSFSIFFLLWPVRSFWIPKTNYFVSKDLSIIVRFVKVSRCELKSEFKRSRLYISLSWV